MCGIMGYAGPRPVAELLLRGLKRLEYRGYDSAGIAVYNSDSKKYEILKSEGKIANIDRLLQGRSLTGTPVNGAVQCGIGHTRWATHGKPTTQNAHPHRTGHVVLVHNGIIENYQEIKDELLGKGHVPASETDSELFGFLVLDEMEKGKSLRDATRASFRRLKGSCSVVVISDREPGTLVGVRNGSPLVAAQDPEGGTILASDAQPILDYTKDVYFLENGDIVTSEDDKVSFYDLESGQPIQREITTLDWSADKLDRGGFAHYMLKEIHEQPQALVDTLNAVLDRARADPFPLALSKGADILGGAKSLSLIACGTSWHASLLGQYWIERWGQVPVTVELASEFRYREPVLEPGRVLVGITQSGETADTLAVIREVRRKGVPTLAVSNVRGSTISREADATFFTSAGPEIGVAATKTFLSQMLVLLLWAGARGMGRGGDAAVRAGRLFDQVLRLPHFLNQFLSEESGKSEIIRGIAKRTLDSNGFFFMGRGYSYPIALEGALKLKEIAYVHAEGYAAGELKHGPIAMLDEGITVVALSPRDAWREKTISNLEEVKARKARVIGVGTEGDHAMEKLCDEWIGIPDIALDEALMPFFLTPVVQLLSYELALLKGTDVDQPRNLAKSVTVE